MVDAPSPEIPPDPEEAKPEGRAPEADEPQEGCSCCSSCEDAQEEKEGAAEPAREQSFSDILDHLSSAANIAASLGEEKVQKVFSEVQEQVGKVSKKGQEAARKARQRMAGKSEDVEHRVGELVAAALSKLRVATKDDIERLEGLVREVRDEVGQLGRRESG